MKKPWQVTWDTISRDFNAYTQPPAVFHTVTFLYGTNRDFSKFQEHLSHKGRLAARAAFFAWRLGAALKATVVLSRLPDKWRSGNSGFWVNPRSDLTYHKRGIGH